jgi:integrase
MAVRAYRLDEVKAYAGHAEIATTMTYVHRVPAHDAADRLSAVVAESEHPTVHPNCRD